MSDLSRFLKRQEKNVRGLYDKNLGSFVEKWKRPVLGGAAGMIPGAAAMAMGPAGIAAAPYLMAAGGAAGAGAGYQRNQEKEDKIRAFNEMTSQHRAKIESGQELDELLGDMKPGEDVPEGDYAPPGQVTAPVERPIAVEPPIDPETGEIVDSPPMTDIPGVDPSMGNIPVGGDPSVGNILDESERARQMQEDLLSQQGKSKDQIRSEMAEMLNAQMERQFSDQVPGYLEDLNTRGLLRSSALGDRLSTERARMSAGVNEQLAQQGFTDRYGSLDKQTGIQDQYLQGRQSALGRKFSLEDYARQIEASKLLGEATSPVTPYTGGGKSGSTQTGMATAGLGLQAASAGK